MSRETARNTDILAGFPYERPRQGQVEVLRFIEKNWNKYDVFVIVAPTACHTPDQMVRLYNGQACRTDELQVGDLLMGPDSKPRTVMSISRGCSDLYKVTPKRGYPFLVTGDHILPCKKYTAVTKDKSKWELRDIEIVASDWQSLSKTRKHCVKLWKPDDIQFPTPATPMPVPPYILGLWLGDGSSGGPRLTTMDMDLADIWLDWGASHGCTHRKYQKENNKAATYCLKGVNRKNPALDALRSIGVIQNKHIPDRYLYGSRQERLELLAGLSDTDGNWNLKGRSFEITQVRKHLAEQILVLMRSLGFTAHLTARVIKGETYYRVWGSHTRAEDIPVRCSRKQAPISSKSNQKHTGFTVTPAGIGDYVAITVDGDSLYLLEDFTVTHNCGKSAIGKTLLNWQYGASYIAPSNMLVDQFLSEFPDSERLHRLDAYYCDTWLQTCAATRANKGMFCRGCVCSSDLAQAKYRRGPGVYNYHTYLAHRLVRPLLIIDEGHNLVNTIQDRISERIWHHDYSYPINGNHTALLHWVDNLPPKKRAHKKIKHLIETLESVAPKFVVSHSTDTFNGKGTVRGEPEERPCLKLFPVDVSNEAHMFWPGDSEKGPGVEKIVLMSATIGPKDIEELGLAQRRVVYLQAASPIPAERRPVQFVPVADLNYRNLQEQVPALAAEITNIAAYHAGEKGIVHVTYELAEMLRPYLNGTKFLFHTRLNKAEQYEKFRNSPASSGRVLVACGMYEGIDLPDDLGRWQVIAKTPWKSLADPAIAYKAERDPDWFRWQTLKDLIQACGRICRNETDYGVTYILDGTAKRLVEESGKLIPSWFRDALIAGNGE